MYDLIGFTTVFMIFGAVFSLVAAIRFLILDEGQNGGMCMAIFTVLTWISVCLIYSMTLFPAK